MPAASTKPETKSSSEAMDPMKQAINLLDKKVRNLEKRKSKLDSYKEKAEKGNVLEKDQEEAISHYSEVHQILEFAKDLQKQYSLITQECEKLMKKQAKREKLEKQVLEQKRFRELLQLQGMLDSLGSENIRNDFKTGKQGAVVLTEENLNQMDELFKLISPSRDGETDYEEQLTNAAEHISSLLDAKDKEVVGTTYKELRELMDLINGCGYFENMPSQEEEEVEEGQADHPVIEAQEQPDDLEQPVLEDPQPVMSAVTASEPLPIQFSQPMENEVAEAETAQQEAPLDNDYQNYSESAAAYQRQRPFQEIVSSVQGSFNFLQESTIDIESPHMDPAVVAMGPAPIPHPTPSEAGPGYGSQSLLADHHHATQSPAQSSHLDDTDPQQSMADYSTAGYNVNHSAAGFPLDDTSTNHTSQNILNQAASAASLNDPAVAGMMAAHIPIPNQSNTLSQDDLSDSNQPEKKPFTMNANAAVFQSMYTQGSGGQGQAGMDKSQGSSSQGGDYQNNYQGNNFRGNRGYRGGRGNQRGGAGMSNGYSRGGSRGGSVNGRGGFGRDNRDTERAPYQGYPPRNDYRPEGYQGYNNNNSGYNNNAGYYNKRGGPNRGGSRGGPRGSSSGGGRGGSGPRSGGFGRPMNAQATMGQ